MSATIYWHELRSRTKSIISWSLAIIGIVLLYFSFYPTFANQAALMNEMMANFPPELLQAFGMTGLDLSTVLGFYSFVFLFIQICVAIQASNYGFGLVSVEEAELTADFLLSKPVTRTQILSGKLLAAFSAMVITNLVAWISSFVIITLFRNGHDYDAGILALLLSSLILFQLVFLSVGLVVSLLVRRLRSVTPYSMALAFGSYVLAAFSGMLGDVALEKITPFKHFDPNYIIQHGALDTPLVMISVVVTILSLAGSYWLYLRRDIPAVS